MADLIQISLKLRVFLVTENRASIPEAVICNYMKIIFYDNDMKSRCIVGQCFSLLVLFPSFLLLFISLFEMSHKQSVSRKLKMTTLNGNQLEPFFVSFCSCVVFLLDTRQSIFLSFN